MSDVNAFLTSSEALEAGVRAGQVEIEPIAGGDPFHAQLRVRVRDGHALQAEGGSAPLDWANALWKARRDAWFERNRTDATKPKIVAIGDSWFHYPFGSDLMEWFERQWALLTFAKAGDTLQKMEERRDYAAAIGEVQPRFFMLSGGGNDTLGVGPNGERNIKRMVKPYDPAATDPLTDTAHETIAEVVAIYERIRQDVLALGFTGAMVVHSYDYASPPSRGPWLSDPLQEMGYLTDETQLAAVVKLVDAVNAASIAWAREHGVIHANTVGRNGRGNQWWFDEIHPTVGAYRYKLLEAFREPMDHYISTGEILPPA